MQKPTILAIDDDITARRLVRVHLEAANYRVVLGEDGANILDLLETHAPDLVLLDLIMPGQDGFATLRTIREQSIVPVIVVSGVGDDDARLRAFALGADDFVNKPYNNRELLARVEALLRRVNWHRPALPDPAIRFGPVEIFPAERRVLRNGEPVPLTATEYALLMELVTHAGRSMTHRMLLQEVWGPEYRDEAEYLRVYISRLRRKLEDDPGRPRHILTEVGIGYRFERRV